MSNGFYSEPKLVQVMERKGIGRPSTYAAMIKVLKDRQYAALAKGTLQPTAMGLEVDSFLAEAMPDLIQTEFTAAMESKLDAITEGKLDWQQYLTSWNRDYFTGAIDKAVQVTPRHLGTVSHPSSKKQFDKSRTSCPDCQNYLVKIPSSKVAKKYFLKCAHILHQLERIPKKGMFIVVA